MNENYTMNSNFDKRNEPVKVLDAPQTVEPWREEENKDWKENVVRQEPVVVEPVTAQAVVSGPAPWLKDEEVDNMQARWNAIQIEFVDEPRNSVEQADALVVEAVQRIQQAFTSQREALNARWLNHEDIQTEDLRVALQNYRTFFYRILAL